MIQNKNDQELLILKAIHEADTPIGSGMIREELRLSGFDLSEATVGRILRDMDRQGLTQKVGFQGRNLTESGLRRLEELAGEKERAHFGNELLSTLQISGKKELIDILVARKVIERETARMAALNASDADVEHLRRIIERHDLNNRSGYGGVDEDIQFHRLIGKIAGNKVLMAAMDLIRQDGQMTPIFEYIRKYVKSTVVTDHRKILHAIASRKPDRAEVAMIEHINNIIDDVEKYWSVPDEELHSTAN